MSANEIKARYRVSLEYCQKRSRTTIEDATGRRMMENYAAVLLSWSLLCDFAGIDREQGDFAGDLIGEMNCHIAETNGVRLPWVWIMEILLSELESKRYDHPYAWGNAVNESGHSELALFLRPAHVMDHISTAPHLRSKFDSLPIKTGRVFKQQLMGSGVVIEEDAERTIRGYRTAHLAAISIKRLEKIGLYASPSSDI